MLLPVKRCTWNQGWYSSVKVPLGVYTFFFLFSVHRICRVCIICTQCIHCTKSVRPYIHRYTSYNQVESQPRSIDVCVQNLIQKKRAQSVVYPMVSNGNTQCVYQQFIVWLLWTQLILDGLNKGKIHILQCNIHV